MRTKEAKRTIIQSIIKVIRNVSGVISQTSMLEDNDDVYDDNNSFSMEEVVDVDNNFKNRKTGQSQQQQQHQHHHTFSPKFLDVTPTVSSSHIVNSTPAAGINSTVMMSKEVTFMYIK